MMYILGIENQFEERIKNLLEKIIYENERLFFITFELFMYHQIRKSAFPNII